MLLLIVEDDATIAFNLALVLEAAGHVVIGPVSTSRKALALSRRHSPTLALVDIKLESRPDGVELARALQRLGIPSVFVSAQHAQAWANQDAAIGFIDKPYTSMNICRDTEVIEALLGGHHSAQRSETLQLFP